MRTRIDIASCAAGPRSPLTISRSAAVNSSIAVNYNPRMRITSLAFVTLVVAALTWDLAAQGQRGREDANAPVTILKPARVFDGDAMHEGWAVRVKGERIEAVGADAGAAAAGAKVIDLSGTTLTPGLVEGHSHVLLHAYSE